MWCRALARLTHSAHFFVGEQTHGHDTGPVLWSRSFQHEYLRGPIPTEIGKLSLLRLLDISACTSMTGTLPSEIGKLTNLKRLMLSHSRFRGTIPTEILGLGLEKLYLTNNLFEGTISTWIGKLTHVKEFMISRNSFTGSIPTEVGRMTKLENFEAYHNQFTGSIPTEIAVPNLKRIGTNLWMIVDTVDAPFHLLTRLSQMFLATSSAGQYPRNLPGSRYVPMHDA
jgi:Leucine-rich repeat (LRR) protein